MKKNKEAKAKHKGGGGGVAAGESHGHVKKRHSKSNNKPDGPEQGTGAGGDAEAVTVTTKKEEEEKETVKLPPIEWDSEAVRNTNLFNDGFNCCTVIVMEDSPELTKYTEYLNRAIETGIRKKFACISGSSTAERVKRFLIATGQRDPKADDTSYMDRHDVFAEAIKFSMMGIKETVHVEMDADKVAKEMELSGARSKEYVRLAPPVTLTTLDESVDVPPPPPPTVATPGEATQEKKPKRKSDDRGSEGRRSKASEGRNSMSNVQPTAPPAPAAPPAPSIGIKTRMRKRGEIPMPELEMIDDTPTKGPQSFVLLQGFYNPKIIEELRNIGVKVEGILLMTDEKVNRYNFSIIDVEDSIPGTFRPKIVLPKYLKAFEKMRRDPETQNSPVTQFWAALTDMYNTAPPDSNFHDLALMNIKLPEMKPGLNIFESPEGMTFFISKVFDEVSKRIYEMLVFEEWHQEFTAAADVNQLQPLEPSLPRDIYDKIIGHIPSECISVPIILEALIQQVAITLDKESGLDVPDPCYDSEVTQGVVMGKSNFGHTNWGVVAKPGQKESKTKTEEQPSQSSLFMVPMYIKAGDFASIRSCHLNESLAAKIASCQLSGDMRNIQGFLWNKVPDFNRGLHMKLLGNLNHFMYFMPPDLIHYEDMFYVLHLLLSAGIEVHLLKESERRRQAREAAEAEESAATEEESEQLIETLSRSQHEMIDGEERKFPGTNLSTEHNYFAMNLKSGLNFVISPDTNNTMTVASLGQSQVKKASKDSKKLDIDLFLKQTQEKLEKEKEADVVEDVQSDKEVRDKEKERKLKKKKSKFHHNKNKDDALEANQEPADPAKVARMTAVGAIETAAEYAQTMTEYSEKQEKEAGDLKRKKSKKKSKKQDKEGIASRKSMVQGTNVAHGSSAAFRQSEFPVPVVDDTRHGSWGMNRKSLVQDQSMDNEGRQSMLTENRVSGDGAAAATMHQTESGVTEQASNAKPGFENMNPSKEKKRFIACDEEWFEDINDASVIQTLLECPALLAISESGALDLSNWVEKYLFSCGVEIGEGLSEGVILGELKNWNFVEELVPIQTVQMLNTASQEYLSMQRMYCPFYDTLLFIFNNPTPPKMTAESSFYFKLKTLPGLQHFLEYTMDDPNVLRWVEQLDAAKRMEAGESYSIQTLLDIIPEEQWLLVPSIKYQIMIENATQSPFKSHYHSIASSSNIGQVTSVKDVEIGSVKSKSSQVPVADPAAEEATSSTPPEGAPAVEPPSAPPSSGKRGSLKSSGKSKKKSADQSEKLSQKTEKTNATATLSTHTVDEAGDKAVSEGEKSRKSNEMQTPPQSAGSDSGKGIMHSNLNFTCYDLGKRVAVVGNDTFFLFPMDGTIIRYDISTIEPEFRMMQLSVTKNGNQTFFYPYYIPRDFDLSTEDYVVCPYFHMILRNGTIFAFQDVRAEEAAPYKVNAKDKPQDHTFTFGFEKVLFGKEVERKLHEASEAGPTGTDEVAHELERTNSAESRRTGDNDSAKKSPSSKKGGSGRKETSPPGSPPRETPAEGKKTKKGVKEKKSKKLHQEKSPENSEHDPKKKEKETKKEKVEKKKQRGKSKLMKDTDLDVESHVSPPQTAGTDTAMDDGDEEASLLFKGETEVGIDGTAPDFRNSQQVLDVPPLLDEGPGEWMYPSSENSEDEIEDQSKRRLFFAPPWDDAAEVIQSMTHIFKVTLPSGLLIQVDDLPGPPVARVVKQSYLGHGSARSQIESSRYYTMDGSVLKFLFNGNIQILTARGVTTNIDELAANASRGEAENETNAFSSASVVKIFNGEVILPNGQHWDVVNGKKIPKNPIYVFTSGPLAGGEVFRRRQDGMICLHRFDGTVITHYPDGTRFTTRMVICENYDEENFPDWIFVGLKYMIEHPNYSTVLFNTLTGNVHLKLPYGEWVRVFADGNIRISTEDEYKLDVDKNRAVLTYPSCLKGRNSLPNITAVRLWHKAVEAPEQPQQSQEEEQQGDAEKTASQELPKEEVPEAPKEEVKPPLEPETAKQTKKDKSRRTLQQTKSLHPKIKQREPNTKKGRSTRISAANIQGGRKSRSPSPSPDPAETQAEQQNGAADGTNKKSEQKESIPEVPIKPPEKEPVSTEILKEPEPIKRKTSISEEGDTLQDFLKFSDETTFCKAVDSWDNRFVMNLYGASLVDKLQPKEESKLATERLLAALSEHSNLPKKYLSGIIRNTSSANLDTAAKRFQALKINSDTCGNHLPKTKIFVVKRDLTGFQYLQKPQVDDVITKAYGSKDSMVVVDPIPQRKPRKFITVMRPVEEVEDPHGMWTRPYIEPMFRPRNVTNKHLIVANPNDLRWFGYILNAAHVKRPKFVQEPKDVHKQKKRKEEDARQQKLLLEQQEQQLLQQQKQLELQQQQEAAQEAEESAAEELKREDRKSKVLSEAEATDVGDSGETDKSGEDGEGSGEEEESLGDEEESLENRPSLDAEKSPDRVPSQEDDKKKKKKKDKNKEKADKEKEKLEKEKERAAEEEKEKLEKEKEKKEKKKKNKISKGSPATTSDEEEDEDEEEGQVLGETEVSLEEKSSSRRSLQSSKRKPNRFLSMEPEIEDYPDLDDILGIYEGEAKRRAQAPRITIKSHNLPCNRKRAIVVRSFVEIPKVDENIQRALLAASMSYAETCKAETALYRTYKTEDPRTAEEKKAQIEYKQNLIEQNIDEMHLLEQKPGPVLRFNF